MKLVLRDAVGSRDYRRLIIALLRNLLLCDYLLRPNLYFLSHFFLQKFDVGLAGGTLFLKRLHLREACVVLTVVAIGARDRSLANRRFCLPELIMYSLLFTGILINMLNINIYREQLLLLLNFVLLPGRFPLKFLKLNSGELEPSLK